MNKKIIFFVFLCLLWIAFALLPLFLPQYSSTLCWTLVALPWIALISVPLCKARLSDVEDGALQWLLLFVAVPVLSLSYIVWDSGLPQHAEILLPWAFGLGALLTAGGLKLSGVKGRPNANSAIQTLLLFGIFGVYVVVAGSFIDGSMAGNAQEETYQTTVSGKHIDRGITLSLPWYFALLEQWIPINMDREITFADPRYVVTFADPWDQKLRLDVRVDLDTYRAFEWPKIGCIDVHKGFFGLSRLTARECPQVASAKESSGSTLNVPMQQLVTRQFAELDKYFGALQQRYEQGTLSEEEYFKIFQEFRDTDLRHEPLYQEWTELYPNSYVAHLLRGTFLYRVCREARGTTFYADVPDADRNKMESFAGRARDELIASLRLSGQPYMSYLFLLNISQYDGTADERRQWLVLGNQIAPLNYYLRRRYMYTLTPKWGGSTEKMNSFLEESRKAGVPANSLAKLEAVIYEDEADSKEDEKDLSGALVAWRRVIETYRGIQEPPPSDAVERVAIILLEMNRKDEAVPVMEELLKVNPQAIWAHGSLGAEYTRQGRYDVAWEHLQMGAKLNDAWCEDAVGRTLYFGAPNLRVVADQEAGLQWIRKAAAQGDHDAVEFLRSHSQ